VNVRNTTNVAGLAGSVANALAGKGFTRGTVENASPRQATVIDYPHGGRTAAEQLRDTVGGKASIRQDNAVPAGQLTVYLGTGYSGLGAPNGAGAAASASGGQPGASSAPARTKAPTQPITAGGVACVN
jgi:hypothetical protein